MPPCATPSSFSLDSIAGVRLGLRTRTRHSRVRRAAHRTVLSGRRRTDGDLPWSGPPPTRRAEGFRRARIGLDHQAPRRRINVARYITIEASEAFEADGPRKMARSPSRPNSKCCPSQRCTEPKPAVTPLGPAACPLPTDDDQDIHTTLNGEKRWRSTRLRRSGSATPHRPRRIRPPFAHACRRGDCHPMHTRFEASSSCARSRCCCRRRQRPSGSAFGFEPVTSSTVRRR